ncbi:MAG: methyltransferase domain-containing protein [Clostridia bacterium]|nr:methyltransferase domain-containing protein [Clostridia bacterium]
MSYSYRLKSRVHEEGFAYTIKYIVYVVFYCLTSFIRNTFLDFRYSGRSLRGNHKSLFKDFGANDTYHTDYSVMPLIFRNLKITPSDVLVDVGCGKGRVINYWLSQKYKNRIIGLELDPKIAAKTSAQLKRHKNVRIISGDAISNLPPYGTIFYFYNPFCEEKVKSFENRLSELSTDRQLTVVYYNPKSLHAFKNQNWIIEHIDFERDFGVRRWGRMNKYHDLAIIKRRKIRE